MVFSDMPRSSAIAAQLSPLPRKNSINCFCAVVIFFLRLGGEIKDAPLPSTDRRGAFAYRGKRLGAKPDRTGPGGRFLLLVNLNVDCVVLASNFVSFFGLSVHIH